MTTRKRILSVLLCAALLLAGAPAGALQQIDLPTLSLRANAAEYSGTCGTNLTWTLDTETGELTISGEGKMNNYVELAPWYSYRSQIKTVSIEDGVTSIGIGAFLWCKSLASVTIPDSVTSIGEYAFSGCTSLASVEFNAINCKTMGSSSYPVFSDCFALNTVTIGDAVTTIPAYAFYGCTGITEITLPDSVTDVGARAFYNNSRLASIRLSANLRHIGEDAFFGTALYTDAGNWTDGVLYIDNSLITTDRILSGAYAVREGTVCLADNALKDCKNLSVLEIPASVLGIGSGMFYSCSALAEIRVDAGNTAYTSDDVGVLYDKEKTVLICCPRKSAATEYSIPDGVTRIGDSAFYECRRLATVDLPDSVTEIGSYAFYNCALTSVRIPAGVTEIPPYAFEDCDLKWIEIGDQVTSIGTRAFAGCPLQNITLGTGVQEIGNGAFEWCNLKSVCYGGTVEQWLAMRISSENDALTSAPRYYHKHDDSMPTEMRDAVECTCTKDGYSGDLVYLPCGAFKEAGDVIHALGHDYITTEPVPSCTKATRKTVICSRCGQHDRDAETVIPAQGHLWSDAVVTEPTCEEGGCTTVTCERCGAVETQAQTAPLGHMFGEWRQTKAPTATAEGEAQRRCSVCGTVETIALAKLTGGETLTITAPTSILYKESVTLSASEPATWQSSDEKVAHIDAATGVLTGKGSGTVTITATGAQTGATATCTVTVRYAWWQQLIRIFLLGFLWY